MGTLKLLLTISFLNYNNIFFNILFSDANTLNSLIGATLASNSYTKDGVTENLNNNIAKISLAEVQDIASGESLQNIIVKRYAKKNNFQ